MIIVMALFIPYGLFMIVKPKIFWAMAEKWKSNDASEPSDSYIAMTRISGGLLIAIGIIGLLVF